MSSIIKLSHRLVDYLGPSDFKWVDSNHTLFPDMKPEQVAVEWERAANMVLPPLFVVIKMHIDTLYIPAPAEKYYNNVLPYHLPRLLAFNIDRVCPDWNIAQKANLYSIYLIELIKAGQKDYMQRIRDKAAKENDATLAARKEVHTPEARAVEGSEDSGELDIKLPKNPNLN